MTMIHKMTCTILLVVSLVAPAHAMVAIDASTSTANDFGTSLTWSHSVGFESNRLLLVGVSLQYATSSSVTFKGIPMTLVGREQGGSAANDGYVEIWSLVAPPAGTGTIVVTMPSGDAIVGGAASFSGVDQDAPFDAFTGAHGQSTLPSVNVSSGSGDLVFAALMWSHDWAPVIAGAGQTELWNRTKISVGFSDVTGAASIAGGGGSIAMSWTTQDDSWAIGAIALHGAATIEYTLAEGATGSFFDLDILVANPNAVPAPVMITFLTGEGKTLTQSRVLPPTSRSTILVDTIPGLESADVSTTVVSTTGIPIVVERTMRWDATAYGSHTEKAAEGAETTWYFAEGSQGWFHTFLLLANPGTMPNHATVHYLVEGIGTVTKEYDLLPTSRRTIDASTIPELTNTSFGINVTFTNPGVAERAMYFGDAPAFSGGHESAGVPGAATDWFLAEGATGSFFTTFLLFTNPNEDATPADVTVTYLPSTGQPVTKKKVIASGERLTVNVAFEDPTLASAAVATQVSSTRPIIVERSQYWPFTPDRWYEAHNSFGVTSTGKKWGLAEGRVGGPQHYQTFILLANPGTESTAVDVTFLRTDGSTLTKHVTVPATTRVNIAIGTGPDVPELTNEEFGALIESTQPIAVERAMYSDANGIIWAAGSNATGTKLPEQ
jgi:hypothetical protein